jgi:copper chaperone
MENESISTQFVLIFKTNIRHKDEIRQLDPIITSCPGVLKWSVDLSDIDKVLRIESKNADHSAVISLMTTAGYFCEELLD